MSQIFTIWSNAHLTPLAMAVLQSGIVPHRLILSSMQTGNLAVAGQDPLLAEADIAFGQPDPMQVIDLPRLRWVHLTAAGYTRYDRADLRQALLLRDGALTNSSSVFDEPCAQHVLAMMLALSRQLPQGLENQRGKHAWPAAALRMESRRLLGQTALILSFGAIARRLVEMLAPFKMNLLAVRRNVSGKESIPTFPQSQVDELLPQADHVINILPASAETDLFLNAVRIGKMKPGAILYNIGRGTTVDQNALRDALHSGHLAAAYLDVTNPEPLPPDHALWNTRNCYITPHTAGGHDTEFGRLVGHFLNNLRRFDNGQALIDRVM